MTQRFFFITIVSFLGIFLYYKLGYPFERSFFLVVFIAFLFEFINGATGMGFGTLSTHMLLWMNYSPFLIVPNILISEFITGFAASHFHQKDKNINFYTHQNKLATLMITVGCVCGVFMGVPAALQIQKNNLIILTGFLTIVCGFIIFYFRDRVQQYQNGKMFGLSILAAFNKSLTGGGFGALLTSGQMVSGRDGKSSAAITAFAKGITGGFGITLYLMRGTNLDIKLLLAMLIGSMTSVPLATGFIKRFEERNVKLIISFVTVFMGIVTLLKGLNKI